ncbi:S-norcoclaurine synthase 1 [Vitis vinifera]|uniref:S-norcoclaurine synthase 1 n=1 Tax=Vitis vinifera TaxID=29760 RepID=A0A438IU28_VITVI|nr:S-norcoclaurine synthase 1 [Vitis vinifera]
MGSEEMSIRKEFGGSLPVANVQALASNNSSDIPIQYLRLELQSEEVLVDESLQIPTIDMRKLMVDDDEMEKLHFASSQRNMRLWPKKPTSFRETLDKYSSELHRVSINLLRSMAKNLGINPDKLASMFEDATQGVRMNYYPPSLLVQVNEVQGLQIKKNGKWVPNRPVPDAFIVNIGDIIEIMSNGEYKSIEHRAVVNPEKEHLSIAAFHSPNYRTMIGPLPDLLKENSANYKTISFEDFVRIVVTRKLDGKNLLGHMKFAD